MFDIEALLPPVATHYALCNSYLDLAQARIEEQFCKDLPRDARLLAMKSVKRAMARTRRSSHGLPGTPASRKRNRQTKRTTK